MRGEIRRLQKALAITAVYVTHDQEEAMAISDHIAVMNGGRIVQIGTAEELYLQPADAFVAQFIGRINALPATVLFIAHGFAAVCVNPVHVAEAAALIGGGETLVCSVVGFPFGTHTAGAKAAETEELVRLGAREMDMVLHIGALKEGRKDAVKADIAAVVRAAEGLPVKVIIEACYLTDEEKVCACRLAVEAGAAFVKTSTGYGSGGATTADVQLMRRTVGDGIGVKAAGGIRTLADALAMIDAGASRIGASASVSILNELVA